MAEARPARPGPLAAFSVAAGPRYGEQLAVPAPVVTIGRAAGSDVLIDDDSVSAQHARLEFDLGAWRLTDLGSVNGTVVEGTRLAPNVPTPLPYGATVRFGGVRLQFREVAQADPEAARAAYSEPAPKTTLKEESRGFRFPVWLAVLVFLLLAVLAYVLLQQTGGDVPAPAPATDTPPTVTAPPPAPAPAPVTVPLPVEDSAAAPADSAAADTAAAGGDTATADTSAGRTAP